MGNPANLLKIYYRGTHLPDRLRSQLTHKSHNLYYFLVADGAIVGKGFPTRRQVDEHQAENYPGEPYEVVSGKVGKPLLGERRKSRKEINKKHYRRKVMMKATKYVAAPRTDIEQTTRLVGIKTDNYSSQWSQLQELVAIAKTDFPDCDLNDLHTVAYDGDRWKRQTGIEFSVPIGTTIPDGYVEYQRLEYIFAGN